MSFYTDEEVRNLGFAYVGKGAKISRSASFYGLSYISIGDFSRIDDFCVLSAGEAGINIGRNVHVAVFTLLIGKGHICLGDFSGLSSRVSVYSNNDDYSGAYMTGPTLPAEYTNVTVRPVVIGRHVIIGSGSVVLPGTTLGEGAAVGALSLVNSDCDPFGVYVGTPARKVKERKRNLLQLEQRLLHSEVK
jgi:acetyltransferase-like isoleucine patch superfamily enzyme